MYQYARNSPRQSSAATSPQSNPSRTNNDRDRPRDSQLDRDTSEPFPYTERHSSEASASASAQSVEKDKTVEKARQVAQNFFKRAALTIISSRVSLAPEFIPETSQIRSTRWFQMIVDECQELSQDVVDWSYADYVSERPPPLIIEIFLDASELTRNQTLVLLDDRGNKWDVCDALNSGVSSQGRNRQSKRTRVVLERWKVQLGDPAPPHSSIWHEPMSNIYKKAIVVFRVLYTYCRFLPAWRFGRRIAKQPNLNALRPMYCILDEEPKSGPKDPLTTPLYPTATPTIQKYELAPLKSPIGAYSVQVSYRVNCDFRVDDSEALLSSHFMGIDDQYSPYTATGAVGAVNDVGSLPTDRKWMREESDVTQAYGSLSTFHHEGHGGGTSPISALRAARELARESQEGSPPQKMPPDNRTSRASKASEPEGAQPVQRRVSVSFQPFKHGSLSSSPAAGLLGTSTPSSSSTPRGSEIGQAMNQARNRTSATALPQAALRAPQTPSSEVAVGSPSSGSPKAPPMNRYSSSFGPRKSRLSSGGGGGSSGKTTEDDNNSSGKGSQSSSTQPGSGILAEGEGAGSGLVQTDDDNISDFLKLLEQKKDLKSFNRTDDASRDASTRRTSAALSKFRGMRDSNAALGDSLSSSMMMQRSSSSSSRQLSSVPPMLAGGSVSTSSSPSKPISPHTPHTPAIPSRLSAHSTLQREDSGTATEPAASHQEPDDAGNDYSSDSTTRNLGSGAIPIPTSPQRYPHVRRSSSAHQRHRDRLHGLEEFDMRPASLSGLGDRADPSLGELLMQVPPERTAAPPNEQNRADTATTQLPAPSSLESYEGERITSPTSATSGAADTSASAGAGGAAARPALRGRVSRRGSGGSSSSLVRGSVVSERGGGGGAGRYSFSNRLSAAIADDDEPLLFTMSELGRRSLDDAGAQTQMQTSAAAPAAAPGASAASRRGASAEGSGSATGGSSGRSRH